MRLWNETGDIEQLDGDETHACFTRRIVWVACAAELFVRARFAYEGDTSVRVDCCEGIVCDLDWGECHCGKERRLANVGFPDDPQLHEPTNVMLPQVPWRRRATVEEGSLGPLVSYLVRVRRRYEQRTTIIPVAKIGASMSLNSGTGTTIELS